ncbi:hypothetical protein ACFFSY_13725 [Paenibacillus aurantiacus]|uniref:Uncharacterized protein n=1 Tax=Paenibacillus aurantiacus TaxID=1936118 RepID=A0ABV5KP24_9BACL
MNFSMDTLEAMEILYRMEQGTGDSRTKDRIDRALDELARNPVRTGDPKKIANNAMGNAGKVLRSREQLQVHFDVDVTEVLQTSKIGQPAFNSVQLKFEVIDFIDRSNFNAKDKRIAYALLNGKDVKDLAVTHEVNESRASLWVTRLKKKIHQKWNNA